MDDTGISTISLFVLWIHFQHSINGMTPCATLFCRKTTLRTTAFTQSSFYPHMLLHREVCTERNFYIQTPLYTEAFTQTGFDTQKRALWPNLPCCLNSCLFFLLPLPDHLPFVFPFPSINRCYPWLSHVVLLVDMSDTHITRIGWSYALVSCFFFALDFSGIEEESLPPPTVKKAGSQEVGIWEKVHWTRRFCLLRRNRVYCRLMDWLGFENCIECLLSMKSMVVWGATQDKEEKGNFAGGVRAGCPGAWVNHSHVHHM